MMTKQWQGDNMGLQSEFLAYAEEVGIHKEDLKTEQGDGYSAVIFGEEGDAGTVYTVMLVFYEDDNEVEIYIGKEVTPVDDLLGLLKRLNELNIDYRGITFLYQADMATLKTRFYAEGELQAVLVSLTMSMEVAKKELRGNLCG